MNKKYERYIRKNSLKELKRKANKSRRLKSKLWTFEEIAYGIAKGDLMYKELYNKNNDN
jgi:hypothetical protein